jgi:hypothetical protein
MHAFPLNVSTLAMAVPAGLCRRHGTGAGGGQDWLLRPAD